MHELIDRHTDTWQEIDASYGRAAPAMRILARELAVGDILRLHDWQLHVVAVDHDHATAVLTAEFGFLLHFSGDEAVDIVGDVAREPAAGVRPATGRAETPPREVP